MFSINARRLFYACDKIIIRNLRGGFRKPLVANPGLEHRLKAFQEDGIKIQDNDAEEFIEQSESSFYEVGESYKEHLNESLIGKHQLKHNIIKERYFKENMPNLLTWSEKEQIRHLASTQPDEWTPERIAESFPVTEQVVKKLLKYPWKPATEERIARHDASAMRNWRELKEGSLDISSELREHFLKFSDRIIPPLNKKSLKIDISQQKMGEFEEIVRRCANESSSEKSANEECNISQTTPSEPIRSKQKIDYKKVTLDELANKIRTRLDEGQNVNLPDRIIMDSVETHENKEIAPIPKSEVDLITESKDQNELTNFKQNEDNDHKVMTYPERIRIPKKAYKKGATYKMNDCFYDHDGRFLYRVIGMTDEVNQSM